MLAVSYGAGTNSTALLIEFVKRGIVPDYITFADTGGERPHTYAYVRMFSEWLVSKGFPEIKTVQTVNKDGKKITLEEQCLEKKMLPSLAYGFKSCSLKHKVQPQDKYFNNLKEIKEWWKSGKQVVKAIGYDTDESHRTEKVHDDDKYKYWYPLVEWDMDREDCVQSIKGAGLPMPGKSACFFCPSSRPHEIKQLKENYPELMDRAIAMEKNAELTSVKGLGRNFAWSNVIATDDMFSEDFRLAPEIVCGCYDGGPEE